MKRLRLFLCLLCAGWLWTTGGQAARVDTVQVYSQKMGRYVRTLVVVPEKVDKAGSAVVYLLHGYGGDERDWLGIKPELKDYADRDSLFFVCPDGENSWYWDSPLNPASQFETFVSRELVAYVDSCYPTKACRGQRAITGFSMGGHGALWVAIRHKEVFGAAGSTSGGVDIRPFPDEWEMKKQIGERDSGRCNWDDYTVVNQLDSLKNGELQIIFDCGYDDFFREVNDQLHRKLLERGVMHDYIVRPGGHTVPYWNNAIDYQLLFFRKYFRRSEP